MSKRRVVVTGLGMLSPVGNTVESTWKALLAGQSGISLIDHFDTSAYATKFAGLVKDFNCDDIISRKEQRKMDAFIQYGIVAGVQAMQDSGLEVTEENASRIGAAIGSGIGGLGLIEENHSSLVKGGPRKISPFFVPSTIVNMVAGHLTIMYGLRGPSISIATACTSGVHNIGHAARIIAYGDAASRVMVSSTKSMTGHLLGAAGAVESIFSILALRDQAIPPTINLDNPDEGCDLDFVPHEARQVSDLEYALCNSFGFGGTNGSLIFKKI